MEEKELLSKIKALGDITEEQRNEITCAFIGHSKIVSNCFGYISCGRCGAQIGDALGGYFDGRDSVVIGHNCETCRSNFEKLTWKDKIYCPDPFLETKTGGD